MVSSTVVLPRREPVGLFARAKELRSLNREAQSELQLWSELQLRSEVGKERG